MKKVVYLARKHVNKVGAGVAIMGITMGQALAVLSTEEQGVLDTITAKVTDYTAPALTVLAAVLGLFITIKWMKKIMSKVS